MDFTNSPAGVAAAKDLGETAAWLVGSGLAGGRVEFILSQFCERLNGSGLRLARAYAAMSTLHPLVRAHGYTWDRRNGGVEHSFFQHSDEVTDAWRQSPFAHMIANEVTTLRRRLTGPDARLDYPVLAEFRDLGLTDWYAQLFDFGFGKSVLSGQIGLVCSLATDRDGGFTEADMASIGALLPVMALAIKSTMSFSLSKTLLATYLGDDPAERVFLGQVRRGSVLSMKGVLFYADLRGFTQLADTLPREAIVELLDGYLDIMTRPVETRGGEVLKFMGDGLIATFGLGKLDQADVCRTALDAAAETQAEIDRFNRERAAQGLPTMQLDLALHLGEVLYGNVGSATRLDFTVVGPAVNETARIETLCKELEEPVLVSASFAAAARHCGARLRSLGLHSLRGVRERTELFALVRAGAG